MAHVQALGRHVVGPLAWDGSPRQYTGHVIVSFRDGVCVAVSQLEWHYHYHTRSLLSSSQHIDSSCLSQATLRPPHAWRIETYGDT
jgi:hypothetical protein